MNRIVSFALAGLALMLAPEVASAYSRGRFNQSGKTPEQSCLACHGTRQYEGLRVRFEGADTASCSVAIEGQVREMTFPKLTYGQVVETIIELPEPTGNDAPQCPTSDCCDPSVAPIAGDEASMACVDRGVQLQICGDGGSYFGCCAPGLMECRAPVAGFNAEVVGGGEFDPLIRDCGSDHLCPGDVGYVGSDGDGTEGDGVFDTTDQTKLLERGPAVDPRQVTHTQPRTFEDGSATWRAFFKAPAAGAVSDAPRLYVGANVANGNGMEDPLDLNSNVLVDVVLSDGTTDLYPSYCLVCADGELAVNGSCCACVSATPSTGVYGCLAACALLGFLLTGRRRRG